MPVRPAESAIRRGAIKPINSPTPATSIATCGPESPSGIGNGGVRSAHPRNRASQAVGVRSRRQKIGIATSGAHKERLRRKVRRQGQCRGIRSQTQARGDMFAAPRSSREHHARISRDRGLSYRTGLLPYTNAKLSQAMDKIKAANRATATLSEMFGELGRCGTVPGSMIRSCSACVPAVARDSSKRAATVS